MKIDRFLQYIPEIERRIADLKPDAIVFGLGPTGWLLPWIDQKLLNGVRLWTCHDGCKIQRAHDLVLMDPPVRALEPSTYRYEKIVASRPDRIWVYPSAWRGWKDHLDKAVLNIVKLVHFAVWDPTMPPNFIKPKLGKRGPEPKLDDKFREVRNSKGEVESTGQEIDRPDTVAISPTGMSTLAWAQGARKIGLIGVDMLPEHGHSSGCAHGQVDFFLTRAAMDAHAKGGRIVNLSPITSLKGFASWTPPSTSTWAPISGSEQQAQSGSLNTVCEQGLPAT